MQTEDLINNNSLIITSQLQLKELLNATFRGESQQQTGMASHILTQNLARPGFVELIVAFIQKPTSHQNQLKVAAANLIKSYAIEHSHHNPDRTNFIELLYSLIMQPHLDMKAKCLLGNALRNQLEGEENDNFKRIVRQKILTVVSDSVGIQFLGSCLVVIEASYESLVGQPDKIIDFIMEFIQPLSSAALQIYTNIFKLTPEEWSNVHKHMYKSLICSQPKLQFLLEFLRTVFNELNDEEDFYQDKFAMLRKNQFLTGLLQSYLILFRSNGSILARSYPSIIRLKKSITALLLNIYYKDSCTETIFNIIFQTVLVESKSKVDEQQEETMLVDCLTFLEMQLENGHFINTFKDYKTDLIFALLSYSVSTPKEYGWMNTDPYLFAQLAEEYTEGVVQSSSLKVTAGSLLKIYAQKIDEIPLLILQRIMIIISTSIHPQSQIARSWSDKIKEQYSKYKFYSLNDQQKVETCLMVLSALEVHFKKRSDFKSAITSFFADQYAILSLIQSPIVSIRLIRAVSYYPSTTYFPYIQAKMGLGKVFALEGIKSLERIIRTNRDRIDRIGFQIISSTLLKLISQVRIEDPIMELIVINYYDQAIKVNAGLYSACRWKIKQSFFANARINTHATMISFNLLYSLLVKEKDQSISAQLQKDFYEISAYLEQPQQRDLFSAFYEKIIEIYQILLEKCINITPEIEKFAVSSLGIIRTQEKGTQIFKFYNSYLIKLNGSALKLQQYFRIFWEQVRRRFQLYMDKKESPDTIPYFCFLMSQIIASCTVTLSSQDLKDLIKMGQGLPKEESQYPLLVILTLLHVDPNQIITFITKHNIFEQFRKGITKIQYQGTIATKIYNLAYMTFAAFRDNPNDIKRDMLIQAIINLRQQNSKARNRFHSNLAFEFKPRKGELQGKKVNGFDLMRDQNDDNQLINLFGKFKHPFDRINEFELFRTHYRTYSQFMRNLQPSLENDLRSIMQTEVLDKDTMRIIQHVRKAQPN